MEIVISQFETCNTLLSLFNNHQVSVRLLAGLLCCVLNAERDRCALALPLLAGRAQVRAHPP